MVIDKPKNFGVRNVLSKSGLLACTNLITTCTYAYNCSTLKDLIYLTDFKQPQCTLITGKSSASD